MAIILLFVWVVVSTGFLGLCKVIYNTFFHPLRKFPGPLLAGATSGWKAYKEVIKQETLAQELFDLHRKYGEIVRIAPNELHFGNPSAFHDIYHGSKRWDKDPGLYRTPGVSTGSFVFLKYSQAKERREVLLPIFSKKAIQNLEHLVWQNDAGQGGVSPGPSHKQTLDHWLVPFSRGPRMCFGMNLAWAELYIAFATMIRRFDLAIDGTTPEEMEWRECIAAYYPHRHLHAWCRPTQS